MTPHYLRGLAKEITGNPPKLFNHEYIYKKLYSEWDKQETLKLREEFVEAIAHHAGLVNFAEFEASLNKDTHHAEQATQAPQDNAPSAGAADDSPMNVVQNTVFGKNVNLKNNHGTINL